MSAMPPRAAIALGSRVYSKVVTRLLEQHGFSVHPASSAVAHRIVECNPSIVVVDDRSPAMTDHRLLHDLRGSGMVPIIVLVDDEQEPKLRATADRLRDIYPMNPGLDSEAFAARLATLVEPLARLARFQSGLGSARPEALARSSRAAPGVPPPRASAPANGPRDRSRAPAPAGRIELILIGASTGGVQAVGVVLSALKSPCPPVVVVQHSPRGTSAGLAMELGRRCPLPVVEATDGALAEADRVWLAPTNDRHLWIVRERLGFSFRFDDGPPQHHQRPAVDATFAAAADALRGRQAVAALLTGMGRDGAAGLLRLREAGAATLAESERTAVVYGMPRAAAELGATQAVLDLPDIGPSIARMLRG